MCFLSFQFGLPKKWQKNWTDLDFKTLKMRRKIGKFNNNEDNELECDVGPNEDRLSIDTYDNQGRNVQDDGSLNKLLSIEDVYNVF